MAATGTAYHYMKEAYESFPLENMPMGMTIL
jgi:hypothetical protein